MKRKNRSRQVSAKIIRHARRCGADLAGVASLAALAETPSYQAAGRRLPGRKNWSVVVVAVVHPPQEAYLDWWDGRKGGTPGNRRLMTAAERLRRWMRREQGIAARHIPYLLDKGGIFLKDAAVLAGLGVIGRNNLLVTPRYGPRIRLRGLLVEARLRSSGPQPFEPCRRCAAPCRGACPRDAFREGRYSRPRCEIQMETDIADRSSALLPSAAEPIEVIRYCRACELTCPIGSEP